jgi:hypothetical protein
MGTALRYQGAGLDAAEGLARAQIQGRDWGSAGHWEKGHLRALQWVEVGAWDVAKDLLQLPGSRIQMEPDRGREPARAMVLEQVDSSEFCL